jgi:hypothetical protein
MDDSERSYGYSRDIYHGRRGAGGDYGERMVRGNDGGPFVYPDRPHRERSYEYGGERGLNDVDELSPEEAAIHLTGGGVPGGTRRIGRGRYDYGYGHVESYTWDVKGPFRARRA